MQDSGWQLQKLKYSCIINPNCPITPSVETVVSYAPMECVRRGYIEPKEIVYGDVPTGLTYFADGDIIMAKVTPCFENGNIGIAENLRAGIGYGSSELFVFRSQSLDTRWLFYYLQNPDFVNRARATMTGTGGLKRVSPSFIRNHSFFAPSIAEQSRIAAYLDRRCAAIDALIANQQQQIDKLKQYKQAVITEAVTRGLDPNVRMKDSGVEWIGEVPEHWDIRKVSTIASRIVVGVVVKPANYFAADGTIPFLRGMNIKDYQIDIQHLVYITPETNRMLAKSIVHENDILVVRDGNIGASCVVPKDLDGSNVVSMIIVTVNADVSPQYICYCLNSRVGKNQFELSKIGSALTHTSVAAVSALQFALPTTEEQKTIVSYLETKCAQIDDLIALKQQKADKLAQYKKSLIYEVVTGKREI